MAIDILSLFTSLGLSTSESKVYIASLKLGPSSVQSISKAAMLSRTATYDTVKSLQDRGLLSTFERGKKTFFAAEDPDRAVSYFKASLHRMEDQLDALSKASGELKMMAGGDKPAVRFYEGNEALYALFGDYAKVNPRSIYEVSNLDDVFDHIDQKVLAEVRRLTESIKSNVKILHIGEATSPREGIQYCKLDKNVFGDFHGDIWIYADRVAFVSFIGKITVVIIENESFADTARFLFNAAWQMCSKK